MTIKSLSNASLAIILFCCSLLIYVKAPNTTSFDSRWFIHQGLSIIENGDNNLDEYKSVIPPNDYRVEKVKGHLYSYFPAGTVYLTTPFLAVINYYYSSQGVNLYSLAKHNQPDLVIWDIERLLASIITALSVAFVFLFLRRKLKLPKALFLTLFYALATAALSLSSRGLWPHGSVMLMLSMVIYFQLLALKHPWVIQFSALPLAYWCLIRPTGFIALVLFTLLVLIKYRSYLVYYLFWIALTLIPFLLINHIQYEQLFPNYYLLQRISFHPQLTTALTGNLFSPARGLFVFNPLFIFSFWGIGIKLNRNRFTLFDTLLFLMIVSQYLAVSMFPAWWGGHSYGNRYLAELTPIFIYFLTPTLKLITHRKILLGIFIVIVGFSIYVHVKGAFSWQTWLWNTTPTNIDQDQTKLWDLKDLQFLR